MSYFEKSISFACHFDLQNFYSKLKDILDSQGWKDIQWGENQYEIFYYDKIIQRTGDRNIEFIWKAKRVSFSYDEAKVEDNLEIKVSINYKINKNYGKLKIKIKGSSSEKRIQEPEPKTYLEKVLTKIFKISPKFLKKTYEKEYIEDGIKNAKKKLIFDCNSIYWEIIRFLGGFSL